ncbi:hypothetical protein I7I53_01327 [Histoplasma capsulatum var. duboisii H88]|uniref:Uncharacterized protein n=1 Tax=Ajellomyces capsulatus (strain H88) TaxID=544711 RepID=A0A8A1LIR9_AJEC8|nr:hypothetical protein I7I53_01327 [Histoplasma capsulatum var. duboisii H88]
MRSSRHPTTVSRKLIQSTRSRTKYALLKDNFFNKLLIIEYKEISRFRWFEFLVSAADRAFLMLHFNWLKHSSSLRTTLACFVLRT